MLPLGSSVALSHMCHATCRIFSCLCTHTSCYPVGSALAYAHIRHATLWDLLLHLHTYVMLPVGSSVALAHICHATLWDLLLQLHTYIMLHCGIFCCTCTHMSCYGLLLHLHTYVMLHCGIFSCTCTHTSCYALGSSTLSVTFVQTVKSLFKMKSRSLVLRSLKKPVPTVQLIDASFHDSAKSWMSKTLGKPLKEQHPNACGTFNSTECQTSKMKMWVSMCMQLKDLMRLGGIYLDVIGKDLVGCTW